MRKINVLANKLFLPICMVFYLLIIGSNYYLNCNSYLWFDEAGQFWIGKGLNHDSDPLSPTGTVMDVIVNNQDYNLDPGGFGVILHYWSKISNGYIWLRTLPYLFYLGIILSVSYLSYRWTKNKYVAVLMGFVPVVNTLVSSVMFEIRAYSMETLGVLMAIIIVDKLREGVSFKRLLVGSIIISVFMTSRYSYWIVAFVTSTYVLFLIMTTNQKWKTKLWMSVVYAIPLLMAFVGLYFLALRWQNPGLEPLSYLPYLSNNLQLLRESRNVALLLKLLIIIWLCRKLGKTSLFSKYFGLAYITVVTNVLFLVLSALGKHPWDAGSTRCISMMVLVMVSSVAVVGELLNRALEKVDFKYLLFAIVMLQFVYPKIEGDFRKKNGRNNMLTDIGLLPCEREAKFYVDRWESPCVRYQCEYGKLKGKFDYPTNFKFAKMFKHGFVKKGEKKISRDEYYQSQPNLNDLMEFDVLIAPELYRNKLENSDKWESVNGHARVWYKKSQNEP